MSRNVTGRLHSDDTERVPALPGAIVKPGTEICKAFNYISFNTYISVWLRIGDCYYKVIRMYPGDRQSIRCTLHGHPAVEVHWATKFALCMGGSVTEFSMGIRDGCRFPTQTLPMVEVI